jgi:hypothetical protein
MCVPCVIPRVCNRRFVHSVSRHSNVFLLKHAILPFAPRCQDRPLIDGVTDKLSTLRRVVEMFIFG